eukprot:12568535-Ditylum_brightwellii.AAC.1
MGKDALVVSDTGRVMEVNPFTPDYDAVKVTLVDAALKYDCPHTNKTYILLVRNALHVSSMDHNVIPPFVLREAGIRVNDTPKIHKVNSTVDDYVITFPGERLRIPLGLWGVFSYFPTSKPSIEQSLIDWKGKVMGKTIEMKIILTDTPDDEGVSSSMMVASAEV